MKVNAKAALKLKIREMIKSDQFSKQPPVTHSTKTGVNPKDKKDKDNG